MRQAIVLFLAAVGCLGCGKSGSPARFYPEVRFAVEPLGGQQGTTFAVNYLASASARHEFEPGRTFTATGPVGFFLENAAPPYRGSFTWLAGSNADLALIISGRTVQVSPIQLGPDNVGPVDIMGGSGNASDLATGPGKKEVRLEVYADPGSLFQGTIGDFFISYDVGFSVDDDVQLNPRAPAFIFFENPRETISAVFRNANDLEITIDLYVDGDLKDSDTSKKDAVVNRDI